MWANGGAGKVPGGGFERMSGREVIKTHRRRAASRGRCWWSGHGAAQTERRSPPRRARVRGCIRKGGHPGRWRSGKARFSSRPSLPRSALDRESINPMRGIAGGDGCSAARSEIQPIAPLLIAWKIRWTSGAPSLSFRFPQTPGWRNWQTRWTQNPVPKGVSVRPRLWAPTQNPPCAGFGVSGRVNPRWTPRSLPGGPRG